MIHNIALSAPIRRSVQQKGRLQEKREKMMVRSSEMRRTLRTRRTIRTIRRIRRTHMCEKLKSWKPPVSLLNTVTRSTSSRTFERRALLWLASTPMYTALMEMTPISIYTFIANVDKFQTKTTPTALRSERNASCCKKRRWGRNLMENKEIFAYFPPRLDPFSI